MADVAAETQPGVVASPEKESVEKKVEKTDGEKSPQKSLNGVKTDKPEEKATETVNGDGKEEDEEEEHTGTNGVSQKGDAVKRKSEVDGVDGAEKSEEATPEKKAKVEEKRIESPKAAAEASA